MADTDKLMLVTNFELLRVLDGHELTFRAEDGTLVHIRLYATPEELIAAQKRSVDSLAGSGWSGSLMSPEAARQLTTPIDVARLIR